MRRRQDNPRSGCSTGLETLQSEHEVGAFGWGNKPPLSQCNKLPFGGVRTSAERDLGSCLSRFTIEERQKAKAIVLGLLYGMSGGLPGYAYKNYGVEIPPDEAAKRRESFFEMYPAIAADHAAVLSEPKREGSVDRETILGRRREGITVTNEAINAPIQGSAADILKHAQRVRGCARQRAPRE